MADRTRTQPPTYVIVVVGFAALLAAQGLLSFVIRPEPYPSVRMPSFGITASAAGTMPVTFARLEAVGADGSIRIVSAAELMAEFRFSAARPSYDHLFRDTDSSTLSPQVRTWLRERVEQLNEGFEPIEVRMCWQRSEVRVVDASIVDERPCTWKTLAL